MGRRFHRKIIAFVFLGLVALPGIAGERPWKRPWRSTEELFKILEGLPAGKSIVAAALLRDPDLKAKVEAGESSYTESTMTRSYSLLDGGEQVEFSQKILLNKNNNLADAVVDLAHELTHFAYKKTVDPYQLKFSQREFIWNGIEGPGGELAAFAAECQISWEFEKLDAQYPKHSLCAPYRKNGAFNWAEAKSDYYAIGSYLDSFPKILGFGVSGKSPIFTSSYAKKPYPVALLEEYEATRRTACENNQRKYRLITAQSGGVSDRAPASMDTPMVKASRHEKILSELKEYQLKNCFSSHDAR